MPKKKSLIKYSFYLDPLIANHIFSWKGKTIIQIRREELLKRYRITIEEVLDA